MFVSASISTKDKDTNVSVGNGGSFVQKAERGGKEPPEPIIQLYVHHQEFSAVTVALPSLVTCLPWLKVCMQP